MTFSQPSAGGDTFDAKDHNGSLLLVYPHSFSAETPTAHGVSASADVDIIIIDKFGPDGRPMYFQNARLFGNLAKSVSRDLGGQVLGRLGQVPTTRGNPAWVLQNFTDADAAAAGPVHAQYQQGLFKATENPMQQQAQTPAPAAASYPAAPAPGAPAQQYAPPAAAPPQQQWQQAPAAPPAQQYQAPAPTGQPAAPAAAPAPAGGADPALLAHLAQYGIVLPPTTPQAQAEAVAATLPQ